MRRILAMLVLAILAITSCAATMKVMGTAPDQDNDGTCLIPVLLANPSASVMIHVRWSGPVSGLIDSLVVKGAAFAFTRRVPPGTYDILAWASDTGGAGCTTQVVRVIEARPDRPVLNP